MIHFLSKCLKTNNNIIKNKTALKYFIKQSVFNCLQIRFSQPLCMKILAQPFCVHIWNGPAGTKGPFLVLFTPRSAFLLPCISSQAFPASTPTLSVVNQSPFPLYSADDRPRSLSPPLFADCRRLIHPYAPSFFVYLRHL